MFFQTWFLAQSTVATELRRGVKANETAQRMGDLSALKR